MSTKNTLQAIRKGEFVLDVSDIKPKAIGFVILFVCFGLFGSWAYLAPIDGAAYAPGTVVVKSYRKTVQHLEGGIIKSLLVKEGDLVQAGDELIILDDTQYKAELGIVTGQVISLEATKARLQAERDQSQAISYPDKLLSQKNDTRVNEAIRNEQAVFEARKASRLGEVSVFEQRLAQIDEQITGINVRITSRKDLKKSYDDEIRELKSLLNDGFVDIQRIREIERRSAEVASEISDLKSNAALSKVKRSETELQILQLEKNFRTEVVDQLSQIEAKLFDLSERERALVARLERTIIRAPESGMVLGMQVHTIGGVVQSGAPILEIVPRNAELIVEAQVSPIDIDRVNEGLEVDVRFSAFNSQTTPVIYGKVNHLSADSLINKETGIPYYLAKIDIPSTELAKLGNKTLLPGMPADALIKTGERTLVTYLLRPATDALARSLIED
ncbi:MULTISPECIES: HlyD family type I secretion periplasmic adaptor subunit [unclassified Marinobacterium]|jgi:epimerase transport system membrane fusion protein|uniref:HlyD family type I secretion periplasmic adaptor subunit n=1 Tax=unclassified Marinobacterium TaxID=2644139 RepID=UPI00156A339B|nr:MULTISPECIES: HlyD family type I secretion periplasmic adaptor subunit [unclassified Marinobacterium]NRP46001.1 Type I secretion system membrane fusion protein PrsE [Marinobacterium sp. xm-d-543]NRQ22341.1 Type I secretion system membrane fusion protein PrsE [Marinobacterium sp. xm-m-312]